LAPGLLIRPHTPRRMANLLHGPDMHTAETAPHPFRQAARWALGIGLVGVLFVIPLVAYAFN